MNNPLAPLHHALDALSRLSGPEGEPHVTAAREALEYAERCVEAVPKLTAACEAALSYIRHDAEAESMEGRDDGRATLLHAQLEEALAQPSTAKA